MITEQQSADEMTFKLAGTLAGRWVGELERCWRAAIASPEPLGIRVDLTEVVFVDEAGRELLASMARIGARLIGGDMLMRAIVEEIVGEFR